VLICCQKLETLIRLTVAHAKCRLSRVAELQDAEAACDVMTFALYNEVASTVPPPVPQNRPVPVDDNAR
jgi:DNA replicative helicase MCM subunit Mcm2 (Cdc46/Mcm family)